jgi:nicotinamidase-related amidase
VPATARPLPSASGSALVILECQEAIIGASSVLPDLAHEAHRVAVPNIARLARAARRIGVPVIHCLAVRHPSGVGANTNAPIFRAMTRLGIGIEPGSPGAQVVPEIGVEPTDLVLVRYHGMGPMNGTELDPVLRNLKVSTMVTVGVSVNVGVTSVTLQAIDAGYEVLIPRDAVAGVPPEWADAMLDNMLRLLATLTTTDALLASWEAEAASA